MGRKIKKSEQKPHASRDVSLSSCDSDELLKSTNFNLSNRKNARAILNSMMSLETQVEKLSAQIDINKRELAELKDEENKLKQALNAYRQLSAKTLLNNTDVERILEYMVYQKAKQAKMMVKKF